MSRHRIANRAKAKKARTREARHRAVRSCRRTISTWLGAGAVTVGVSAALASGSGIAHGAPAGDGTTGSSSTSSGGTSAGGSTSSSPSGSSTLGSSTGNTGSAASGSLTAGGSTGSTGSTGATGFTGGTSGSVLGPGSTGQGLSGSTGATGPSLRPSGSGGATGAVSSGSTGATGSTGSATTRPFTHTPAVAPAGATGTSAPGGTGSSLPAGSTGPLTGNEHPLGQSPLKAAALVPTPATSAPTLASTPAPSSAVTFGPVTPPAPLDPPTMTVNPLEPLLDLVMGFFGVNPNVPPTNFLQLLLYSLFIPFEQAIDPAPPAGTPIVGAADPNSGTVFGNVDFPIDPSGDVTYTATSPSYGALTIDPVTEDFSYTPTAAARENAATGSTDAFTVTAHDGPSTTSVTVTVPVDAGTPQAGAVTESTPNPLTGTVFGNPNFIDPAGRTLTYSAATTSTDGGTVTVNASTGAFTYTPTQAQRQAATATTTDSFTETADNGVHSATEPSPSQSMPAPHRPTPPSSVRPTR